MADDPQPPRPVRAWPALALTAVYWAFQLIIARSDMAMFPLFLSKALGNLAFLLVFLVLWLSNGTLTGRVRLLGLGVFLGGIALGIAAAHRSFDPMGFLMTAVPMVLTFWAGWLLLRRARGGSLPAATLAAAILLPVVHADLIRWEGLDGRLRPTHSWRW
ncbi:MAG: hypothetical protein HY293_19465, partial [Planctomycetes bacterium]|nr:hypothetical protein [Planctomycetota bacterium]